MNMKLIQFGFLLLFNVIATRCYEMSTCPTAILWDRRAAEKCYSKRYYHCLYDTLYSNSTYIIHQERCITEPKKYKGKRFVLSGNLNAIDCPSDRYTPEPTWSNTLSGSECPFKKSFCAEEGQVFVDNGTSKTDRTCRCNYKLGYNYVVKPLDPCKCKPAQEDCSCYIHRCSQKLEILSQDYDCVEKPRTIGKFACSKITDQMAYSEITNISAVTEFDSIEGNRIRRMGYARYAVLILDVLMLFLVTALLARLAFKKMKKQQDADKKKQYRTIHEFLEVQISMTEIYPNAIVLKCQLPVSRKISKVEWKFKSGELVTQIPTGSTEKYDDYSVLSPSLTIRNCKASDSGTYQLLVNSRYTNKIEVFIPEGDQLAMTIQDHNTIVLNCQLLKPIEIKTIGWIFRRGTTAKVISTSTEKYEHSESSLSLKIKSCEESDSGTYECIVNSLCTSKIEVVIPKEIYREPINVVPYYQETKQLLEIERALRLNGEKLVILKGMSGSGKTQTASRFCERYKMMYSIVAKLSIGGGSSLKQPLLELLEDQLKWQYTSNDKVISFAAVVENFQNFLNHKDRKNLPFLLVVDIIEPSENVLELTMLVPLTERVSGLNIILTLTSREYLLYLQSFCHSLIEFDGMNKKECEGLFKHLVPGENDEASEKLVEVIGNTPIILVTVLKYIYNMKESTASFLTKYKSTAIPMMEAILTDSDIFHDANKPAFTSQLIPLEHIKRISREKDSTGNYLWKVMNLIPFLEYDAVSQVVLQACYRHLSNNIREKKKTEIDFLVKKLSQFSLCQIVKVSKRKVGKKTSQPIDSEGVMYIFHKVTMNTVALMGDRSEDRNFKIKIFLLKLFCSEIDIDARTDITVARNLLFVPHANKLLLAIKSNWATSLEQKFLISYLYCAIGSTLLFDRTNVKHAHVSLMKARAVIDRQLKAVEDKCLQHDSQGPVSEEVADDVIELTSQDILECELEMDFVRDFVLQKRRNRDEVTDIRSAVQERTINNNDFKMADIGEYHYLTENEYKLLEKLNLALPIEVLSKILLAELLLKILIDNALALHYISSVKNFAMDVEKRQRLTTSIGTEAEISQKFCKNLKRRLNESLNFDEQMQLFVCLQSDSSAQFLKYKYSRESSDTPIDTKIEYFEKLLKHRRTESFEFGVIKLAKTRFKSYCQGNIIQYCHDKIEHEQNEESKKALFTDSMVKVNTFMREIRQMEERVVNHTWLVLPLLYIECGQFFLLSEDCAKTQKAIEYFDKALEFERSRGACWTRFIFKGFEGKIRCLRKLNKNSVVEIVIQEVEEMLRGQNREEFLSYFQRI